MKGTYRKMVDFDEAISLAMANFPPIEDHETVSLMHALGRISAVDLTAPMDTPQFHRSTMDGFAVKSDFLAGASQAKPIMLEILWRVRIGQIPSPSNNKTGCWSIATGAVIPEGYDAVVPVEETEESGGSVIFRKGISKMANIAEAGSDSVRGDLLFSRGTLLGPHETTVMASHGITQIEVHRQVKVKVISTGSELIPKGSAYERGKIFESNSQMILSMLDPLRIFKVSPIQFLKDDFEQLKKALYEALSDHDIVIVTGGSSAGNEDYTIRAFSELDPGIIFHGVKMKPGLPAALAKSGDKVAIALPGFPVSSATVLRSIFLEPMIAMSGGMPDSHDSIKSSLNETSIHPGRANLIPAIAAGEDRVILVPGQSGSISRLLETGEYAVIKGGKDRLDRGERVMVKGWFIGVRSSTPLVVGEIDALNSEAIRAKWPKARFSRISISRDSINEIIGMFSAVVIRVEIPPSGEIHAHYVDPRKNTASVIGKYYVSMRKGGHVITSEEAFSEMENAPSVSGPSSVFFRRIITNGGSIQKLIESISNRISSYHTYGVAANSSLQVTRENPGTEFVMASFADLLVSRNQS